MSKYFDLATWVSTTVVAALGAAASQDFSSTHGKLIAGGAILAVIAAALKNPPDFAKAPPAPQA